MKENKAIIFILLTFLLIPIVISCESKTKGDAKIIKVDVDAAKKGKISDHFESIEYILLDYPDSLPIVGPYKMILTDDRILVESRETAAVFFFDRKGNLQNVIRDYGDGPGQFRLIDDMFLEGHLLRIHSTYLKKYMIFSLKGKLIEEGKMDIIADRSFLGKDFSLFQIQKGYGTEKFTIIRKGNESEIQGFLPLSKDLEDFYSFNNIHGFQYDPYRDSFYLTSMLDYKIPIFDGKGFLKQTIEFDFGNKNFHINKWKEMRENPRGLNTWISDNGIVQSISSFFPFKNKILVKFNEGIKTPHFLFLDNNFDIIYHVDELENDFDGMKLKMWSWAYSENEIVYALDSKQFYNDYVETFNDKKVTVKKGDIHDFFRNNKEKLKEEKYVLVVMKVKE
ncbi:6-bladed beta-propeller [Cognataquiflexum rubidum]|uniref:6-bladed beta-propeller n=1 Tax=Cognataquiflexum rubidum TaxID=2922273 RepID=UPI001F1413C3|nr:6-bladed beta-propeller [Cognataquiflexum rubidum]MCH6234166.1 6-bladed beta-propeller [Cognataquiflexum rubidum]